MYELDKQHITTDRQDITIFGRPKNWPAEVTPEKNIVVCDFIRAEGMPDLNRTFICKNVSDMQRLYDEFARGGAVRIEWYLVSAVIAIN